VTKGALYGQGINFLNLKGNKIHQLGTGFLYTTESTGKSVEFVSDRISYIRSNSERSLI
jgi:hypothetical protein